MADTALVDDSLPLEDPQFAYTRSPPPSHYAPMPNASLIQTHRMESVKRKLLLVLDAERIMFVFGDAGLGKTLAVRWALQGREFFELTFSDSPNRKETIDAVHEVLFGRPGGGNAATIERTLKRHLARHPTILVVDEVESLSRERLRLLGTLEDFRGSKLILILIGDPSSVEKIRSDRRLDSRILTRSEFRPMGFEAVSKYLLNYHPIYVDAKRSLLSQLFDEVFGGNWREIAKYTKILEHTAAQHGITTLTPRLIEMANSDHWKAGE